MVGCIGHIDVRDSDEMSPWWQFQSRYNLSIDDLCVPSVHGFPERLVNFPHVQLEVIQVAAHQFDLDQINRVFEPIYFDSVHI